jgi:hypothetical protein
VAGGGKKTKNKKQKPDIIRPGEKQIILFIIVVAIAVVTR